MSRIQANYGHYVQGQRNSLVGNPRLANNRRVQDNGAVPISFVFAINEISIRNPRLDTWGNTRPPESPGAYHNERSGVVMMYCNGIVEPVQDQFCWHRDPNNRNRGSILFQHNGNHVMNTETYKTSTVFSCHPLMPFAMVNVDASVERTFNKQNTPDDERPHPVWEPLHFFHPKDHRKGLSQAVFSSSLGTDVDGGSPVNYVAGQNASWIPSLVPPTYRYPYDTVNAPQSRGLGGDLTILLGLMAFSPVRSPIHPTVELALPTRWRGNRWCHTEPPRGYASTTMEAPKGFIITVALDPKNPRGSTRETLRWLEYCQVLIKE